MEEEKKPVQQNSSNGIDEPITLDESSFSEAVKKYVFLVVDCWAEWCGPCRMVHPVIESLAKKYKGQIVFGKLDVDGNRSVAAQFGIMSIPTLLVFKNGEHIDSIIGAMPEQVLEQKLLALNP